LLIGICTYEGDEFHDLEATKVDIDNVYNLFSHKYNYRQVFKNNDSLKYDKLKNIKPTKKNIKKCLAYHSDEIERINDDENIKDKIDS